MVMNQNMISNFHLSLLALIASKVPTHNGVATAEGQLRGGRRNEVVISVINDVPYGIIGLCPNLAPETGMPCRAYIPPGAVGTMCLYDQRHQCECNLEIEENWWCWTRPDLPHLNVPEPIEQEPIEQKPIEQGPIEHVPVKETIIEQETIEQETVITEARPASQWIVRNRNRNRIRPTRDRGNRIGAATRDRNRPVVLCPREIQETGMPCSPFVAPGNVGNMCMYGSILCECDLSIQNAWWCEDRSDLPGIIESEDESEITGKLNNAEIESPIPSPQTPAPTPLSTAPPTLPPTPPPRQGEIHVNIINPDGCPDAKPANGMSCNFGQRCKYWVETNGLNTGTVNCDCNGNYEFQCRPDNNPTFSF